ncbi:RNA recognition motif containing protein [Carpediemonas membranifera]|uniref:RNA recognition motif containing protein n=1 Tax=Carpediemonas membranifera TaxID=201153 RepID=A0A8J6E0Q0_9EUKA|nr:RNA recognition motif containing protein [Carpediemonas membranifera]|eukprot:KAG9395394.1 RNA recognition motif containing protein [Carpediemonas membranifera]
MSSLAERLALRAAKIQSEKDVNNQVTSKTSTDQSSSAPAAPERPVLPRVTVSAAPMTRATHCEKKLVVPKAKAAAPPKLTIGKRLTPNARDRAYQLDVKKSGVKRTAAGKTWVDEKLAGWSDTERRLFVGNLLGSAKDEDLAHMFRHYPSVTKVRVVNDKTKKSNYGFVSFADEADYLKAFTEMKHSQEYPYLIIQPSKWAERNVSVRSRAEKHVLGQLRHDIERHSGKKFEG